ncbi:DNA polymerase III subunit alpha [Sphingoaurantiacus capsulatus]|uniref:DNA polymerase III subunit alpha n=1 Tax=Sphingoaurantiacus capsulatus TaxID=1771310 RepID=A0ABV7XGN3_9SPHN
MPHQRFVHLRVQSAYSMLEGAMQPKDIAKTCRKLEMPAVAVTDRNNMFGAMEFADYAKGEGVQPIMGALVAVARPGKGDRNSRPTLDWLVLLAQDETGYANLIELVSRAHLDGDGSDEPHLTLGALHGRSEGLIALTAGAEGALARLLAEEQRTAALAYLADLEELFPDRLYIEIARCDESVEQKSEEALIALAYERNLPLVATNPVAYAGPEFHEAHDVMLCIADGAYVETKERRRSGRNFWLKSAPVMCELFADLPEAIANTLVVAQRCSVMAPARAPILPSLAGDREGEAQLLIDQSHRGLDARLERMGLTGEAAQPYRERIDFELNVINNMGFAGYFLIVADFIQWAKGQGIPVGPGRGSGAGSVVAWALTITDLDPLQLGLLFERFLNPERVSMPDFDIDFCETRRGEVIDYVQQKYGSAQVAQIITFGKMKARAVLKDVGRVLQMPYGQVDRLAKLVPNHPTDPWTLERALNGVPELAQEAKGEPAVRRLLDLAQRLEGLPRHSSTHAAGVVIGDRPLSQLVPMYRDPRSDMGVTQFDMKWVEKAGLVKFDFLGLKTLSVLQRALELLAKRSQPVHLDLAELKLDDPKVYELLQRGDTVGVFQLESEGMRRTLAAVRPTNFGDIIALVSLYRPGPMDNIPLFGARKNGREKIEFPHALLKDILAETYGIFVYQEQVMQAAQVLAGYSLGQADLLRRAMGKKIQAEMDAQRATFVAGCAPNNINETKANELFDLIDKFAGYGFNKSHAAAYALVAYHTAWLKAHYPVEFYAASMAYDIALTDKLAIFMDDMRRSGVVCLPPCLNKGEADFSVECTGPDRYAVRYALGALKGVGEKAMTELVAERQKNGPFETLGAFVSRVDAKLLNKRQVECLVAAGAFDGFEPWNRAELHAGTDVILRIAVEQAESKSSGQASLFGGPAEGGGGSADAADEILRLAIPRQADWNLAQTMAQEKDAFGFFFSGHPLDQWRHVLDANGARTYAEICEAGGPIGGGRTSASMAGMVESVRWRTPQNGNSRQGRYLLIDLTDSSGNYMASCFDDEAQAAVEAAARSGEPSLVSAELLWRPGEEQPRVTVRGMTPLAEAAKRQRSRLTIDIATAAALDDIKRILETRLGGRSEVQVRVPLAGHRFANLSLGRGFTVDGDVQEELGRLASVRSASLSAMDVPRAFA